VLDLDARGFPAPRERFLCLLDGLVSDLGARDPWWIDAPETNPAAIRLAEDRGLVRGFRTSRMYRGRAPDNERSTVFGVTTLELG
jgi:Acetyltransferase (GNAT) domain